MKLKSNKLSTFFHVWCTIEQIMEGYRNYFSHRSSGTNAKSINMRLWSISIALPNVMPYCCYIHLNVIHCVIALCHRYERFEVLAVFTTTILVMFGALFIVKER